jgi:hypothetical protein
VIVYLAQLDSDQPVDAAKTTLEAAQKVVEELAQEHRLLPAGVHWEHLGRLGYPTCWAYTSGDAYGLRDDFGQVQQIEVTV